MGHNITAVILKGDYDKKIATEYDLLGIKLKFDLTLFHIDLYFVEYWQYKLKIEGELPGKTGDHVLFPREKIILVLLQKITNRENPLYTIIATNYFGGFGYQWAQVYQGDRLADEKIDQISPALAFLGVKKADSDEFDAVGLSNHRSPPEYLEKYVDLLEEEEEKKDNL